MRRGEKLSLDFSGGASLSAYVNDADPSDPDQIELVIQLCTRIGMIMENVIPLALDASCEGLEARVTEIGRAIRTVAALSDAAAVLLVE